MARYRPPVQSGLGQFIDGAFLMAMVFIALFVPLELDLTGAATTQIIPEGVTRTENADGTVTWTGLSWEALDQNPVMAAQYEKLGYTPETAADLITTWFDYTIDPVALIISAIVIVGYFVMLFFFSEREYREVIAEKFENRA
jgi:hypothetical protein